MTETLLTADALHVLDGVEMHGSINTPEPQLVANVNHAIRLGYPQVWPQGIQPDRVCLVGGGPSLDSTLPELRDLYFDGAKVVTVNGSYRWCLEHNIRPSAQIVLDARVETARFVYPAVPRCKYLVASQCAPETWAAVAGRPDVWIWHSVAGDNDVLKPLLDDYYLGKWTSTPGGTTVIVRAIILMRLLGYLRMDLFGVDSCFMDGKHHAYEQAENDCDRPVPVTIQPSGHPEHARQFLCAGWHVKQLECFLQTIKLHGDHFLLNVHGDGLLAYALSSSAAVEWTVGAAERSTEA